ncbi:MAG: phosphatidylserine decarboxylase [Candidatus Binatia bacterium]
MRFAKEGYVPAAVPALLGMLVLLWPGWTGLGLFLLLSSLLVLLFFRDPERYAPAVDGAIISPADGRVVYAGPHEGGHRMAPEACRRVSIFMSVTDVHVNRSPIAGTVREVVHRAGRFRAAFREDASEVNESSAMLIDAGDMRLVIVQIAGLLARRIVCRVEGGQRLERGQRFGLIMFGSRVDVFLPESVALRISTGEKVKAGHTVLAEAVG